MTFTERLPTADQYLWAAGWAVMLWGNAAGSALWCYDAIMMMIIALLMCIIVLVHWAVGLKSNVKFQVRTLSPC
jgi:hypothetical protein